jgi:diaminopimelate decarboxylase
VAIDAEGLGVSGRVSAAFPSNVSLAGGRLAIAGCDLIDLAERFGTPAYVVDELDLVARARAYVTAFERREQDAEVVFASKSFPCGAVAATFADLGLSCDVTTGGELHLALRAGFDPSRIVMHGNAKGDDELSTALQVGVGRIVVDSFDDIRRLEAMAIRPQSVLIRVIPDISPDTHPSQSTGGAGSKFGLGFEQAKEAIRLLQTSTYLRLDGLHSHIGSQVLDLDPFAEAVERLSALGDFPVYDLGGGLGVRYRDDQAAPSIDAYVDTLVDAVRSSLGPDKHILVEPGRSLTANACVTIYRVVTVKRGDVVHVAVDGGTSDNLEAVMGVIGFDATIADRPGGEESCVVVGKHCDSGDTLVKDVMLDDPRPGDVLVVPGTGAYSHSTANNFNAVPRPPILFCRDGEARVVVRRETLDDVFVRDAVV